MRSLFRQFSFPGGVPSHAAPRPPVRSTRGRAGLLAGHAYGAAFDHPDLLVAGVVGDGEAETGALATSWHSNKFLNPAVDGRCCRSCTSTATRSPTPRCWPGSPQPELTRCSRGTATRSTVVEGDDPGVHRALADALDTRLRPDRRHPGGRPRRRRRRAAAPWPMIVLRTPKGWTGPAVGGRPAGRGHVPVAPGPAGRREEPRAPRQLESWMRSYRPDELFDERPAARRSLELRPDGDRRMGATPHANGAGCADLDLPDFRDYAVDVPTRRRATRVDPSPRRLCATSTAQPAHLPALRPRRDQQPARRRCSRPPTEADRRAPPTTTTSRPTAG